MKSHDRGVCWLKFKVVEGIRPITMPPSLDRYPIRDTGVIPRSDILVSGFPCARAGVVHASCGNDHIDYTTPTTRARDQTKGAHGFVARASDAMGGDGTF